MEQFVRKKKPKSPKPPKSPEASKSPNNSPDGPEGEIGSPDEDMMKQCKEMMHQKHHEKVVQADVLFFQLVLFTNF